MPPCSDSKPRHRPPRPRTGPLARIRASIVAQVTSGFVSGGAKDPASCRKCCHRALCVRFIRDRSGDDPKLCPNLRLLVSRRSSIPCHDGCAHHVDPGGPSALFPPRHKRFAVGVCRRSGQERPFLRLTSMALEIAASRTSCAEETGHCAAGAADRCDFGDSEAVLLAQIFP